MVTLQSYYLPWHLEEEIRRFVGYYNKERAHESLENLTPADVYHRRGRDILTARERLKRQTALEPLRRAEMAVVGARSCVSYAPKGRASVLCQPAVSLGMQPGSPGQ